MTIRSVRDNEVTTVVDVLRRSFADVAQRFALTPENCGRNPAFCTDQRVIQERAKGVTFYFLEDDGQVCGCVAMEHPRPEVVYLERLGVLPEHRSKGLGRALVHHVFAEAKAAGAARVEIAIISLDNPLKNWYRQFGFVETSTRKFDHLPFVVAFMAKELRSGQS
jgi:ribosomal protein S18 acetylase RimI-like enzyme